MDYEKETYLNTERLNEMYRHDTVLTASIPSSCLVGGIRFVTDAARTVRLQAEFPSLSGRYTPYVDGRPVMQKCAPSFSIEVTVGKGEHVFEIRSSAAHGGAILRVMGVGVRAGRRYFERVGGYYTATRTVLYLKRGDHTVDKVVCDGNEPTVTELTDLLYDSCLCYDKTEGAYNSTIFYFRHLRENELKVNTSGQVTTITIEDIVSAAIADGQTLPTGYDCIVACTDTNGELHFFSGARGGMVSEATTTVSGIKKVASAQRGSILLVQDRENVWRAFVFGAGGDKSITVNGTSLPYSVISLSRNAVCAPSADLGASLGQYRFYFKDGKGILRLLDSQGETESIGYADEYYAGAYGMLMQDNELSYDQSV